MLNYTATAFNRRMMRTPEGTCITCGGPAEYESKPNGRGGYSSTCLRCFGLFHDGKAIGHSHMFQYPDGYIEASGAERIAWPTTVDLYPAFVSGEHVGWFCGGGHGSEPCEWTLTNDEAQPYLDAFKQ